MPTGTYQYPSYELQEKNEMNKIYAYLLEAEKNKSYQDVFATGESKLKQKISEKDWNGVVNTAGLFEQNKLTKLLASKEYNKNISLSEAYWIIINWGGIGSFKQNERNSTKILQFLEKIKKGYTNLTRQEFSTISSLSKLSFFYDVDKYCIYDSRVIYSLNWIIYKTEEKDMKFYPMPNGRNNVIANYPMEAIIKFTLLEQNERNFAKFYYSHKDAYTKYNELMIDLSRKLYGKNAKPFYAEMLLFNLADTYVHQDMKNEIQIRIKSKI